MHSAVPDRRRRVRICAIAVAFALIPAACGTGADEDPRPTYTATSGPGTDDPGAPDFPMPDTPVGRQAQWIVDQVAAEAGPTTDEASSHLSDDLLAGTDPDGPTTLFTRVRAAGPMRPVDLDVVGAEAVLRLRPTGSTTGPAAGDWRVVFALGEDDRVDRLTIAADDGVPDPATWAELLEQLTRYDAEVGLYVARIDDGRCEPIAEAGSDRPTPIASTFKLWVLEAVARAVEDGTLSWNQRLTVDDDVRSLPSGTLQDQPTGHQVSLSQAAAGMIAISDNTAADMLIRAVGRDAVEATMRDTGHSAPELNTPLLTTREFFTIGWSAGGALLEAWRAAADAGSPDDVAAARRNVVDDVPRGPLSVTADDVEDPVWPDGVDWFATPGDVCRIMAALHARPADDPDGAMLRTILGHNRGTDIDPSTWPYVAYKGGSARGVLAASWLGERAGGERYFVSIHAAADTADALRARSRFFGLGRFAFDLLASTDTATGPGAS